MIEIRDITKTYKTGDLVQRALDGVSVTFRESEFVAVLGPSGSGKTTFLNILGGFDHADSGDIVVNGTSTRDYTDAEWDTYRNHRVGFIFQSYNLIPHQTILANVELALTLAGVDRAERERRARAALERVGLGAHVNKKPSQLSGGQMQRVAIARALVNDPEIVLADEPTGALDTETGIQVMDLLAEVARERLVIMVTHNPQLAEDYATRIVRIKDGRLAGDTCPVTEDEVEAARAAAVAHPDEGLRAPLVDGLAHGALPVLQQPHDQEGPHHHDGLRRVDRHHRHRGDFGALQRRERLHRQGRARHAVELSAHDRAAELRPHEHDDGGCRHT